MNFTWKTPKQEVIDSVKRWGFTFNPEKQRWDRGTLNGYRCNKLKLYFGKDSLFEGAEAKFLGIDTTTSREIFERFESQTHKEHGAADMMLLIGGEVAMMRAGWQFAGGDETANDMIVIDRFDSYVLFHAARNMPPLFDLAPVVND